jgi:hypothetical protein
MLEIVGVAQQHCPTTLKDYIMMAWNCRCSIAALNEPYPSFSLTCCHPFVHLGLFSHPCQLTYNNLLYLYILIRQVFSNDPSTLSISSLVDLSMMCTYCRCSTWSSHVSCCELGPWTVDRRGAVRAVYDESCPWQRCICVYFWICFWKGKRP